MKHFVVLLASAGAVAANQCQAYNDNFDDLKTNPVAPQLNPVGTYHGIAYQAFAAPPAGTGGVLPESGHNVAAATMQQDELQLGSLSLTPFGNLVAATSTEIFNLYSFYFGCVLDDHTDAATTSEACTLAVTGFYANGKQAPEVTYAYSPTNDLAAPMNLAVLPASYLAMKNVTIGVAGASVLAAQTVLFIDNVVHCNYQ